LLDSVSNKPVPTLSSNVTCSSVYPSSEPLLWLLWKL
jgi:hypothetical protein